MPKKLQLHELLTELPPPSGADIKALLDRKHWTYKLFAELVGVGASGQRQTLRYVNGEQPLSNMRWTMAKLFADEHPTLRLVPRDPEQAAALGMTPAADVVAPPVDAAKVD